MTSFRETDGGGSPAWAGLLAAPEPGQHIVQLCADPDFFVRSLARFVAEGLRRDEGVVVIATPVHRYTLARELARRDVGVAQAELRGQLILRDAEQTLSAFMVDGLPDPAGFREFVEDVLARLRSNGYARVRAFGEMVDLLRHRDLKATWSLERLWQGQLRERGIALLCGYSLDVFDPTIYRGLVQQIAAAHSHLVPIDDYDRLERAVGHAYEEIFGGGADADDLRRTFVECYARPAAMPDAAAAILALREFVPGTVTAVLDSARRRYGLAA
jgi:hypothetical protein